MGRKKDHDYFAMLVEGVNYACEAATMLKTTFENFEPEKLQENNNPDEGKNLPSEKNLPLPENIEQEAIMDEPVLKPYDPYAVLKEVELKIGKM